jgi:hypothetical protein
LYDLPRAGSPLRHQEEAKRREAIVAGTWPRQQEADAANIARVYDYLLGGSHNSPADQAAAEDFRARWPEAPATMRANRAFLGRAVRYLAGQADIRQFLDIGSGIPTMGNVREIAQDIAPGSRIAYVDRDEVAVLHSRAILAGNTDAIAIQADLRAPREILDHPALSVFLDLSQPVALLLVAVPHFLPDKAGPASLLGVLRDTLAPGSYLVISHGTTDAQPRQVADAMNHYDQTTAPFQPRGYPDVLRFFDGYDLIEPGLVHVPLWRPDTPEDADRPERAAAYGGVGRKPSPQAGSAPSLRQEQ